MMKTLDFQSANGWRAWLEENHATATEAWLVIYKTKAAGLSLTLDQAVEEALCFGWIDGLLRKIDDEKYALRFSPRKPRSVWAESNKQRVEKLIQEGRMTAAGLEKVAEAKANGEWEAATSRENVDVIPIDLMEALKQSETWRNFTVWPAARRKMYLYWLNSAKRPETRLKRIQAIIGLAAGYYYGGIMTNKAQILTGLQVEFQRWQAFLSGLSEAAITAEGRVERLSIKDIVAHLTAWQKISLVRMEAARQNREPDYPAWPADFDSDLPADTDRNNSWIYETYRDQSWSNVYQEWKDRYQKIIDIGSAVPESDLLEIGKYLWLADYPLAAVLTGTVEHHKEHLETLLSLLKRNG